MAGQGMTDDARGDALIQSHIDSALYNDIALVILGGERNLSRVARHVGVTRERLRTLMTSPAFATVYNRVRDDFYANLTKTIQDETADPVLRRQAAEARAMTALSEVTEFVRKELQDAQRDPDKYVGPGQVKNLIDAAVAQLDRAPGARLSKEVSRATTAATLQRSFAPTAQQASVIKESLEESGVDLSDLFVHQYNNDPKDDADGEGSEQQME